MLRLDGVQLHLEFLLLEALWDKLDQELVGFLVQEQALQSLVVNLTSHSSLTMLDTLFALIHAEMRRSLIGHPIFVSFFHVLRDLIECREKLNLLIC